MSLTRTLVVQAENVAMSARGWSIIWPRGEFARLVLLAVAVRLLLVPLTHTWDGQTWANVFAELSQDPNPLEAIRRPYETMRELSLLTAAAGRHSDFYEYWAYPPLQLYIYWPLAHLYTFMGGAVQPSFAVQPAMIAPSLPMPLLALIHAPSIAADVVVLFIMRALGVGLARLRWYAFNPLVLLVGVWTFDAVMVAFLLFALYWAEQRRPLRASAALGLGAATKFVALAALPAVLLGILDDDRRPIGRRILQVVMAMLTCGAVVALVTAPVADGVAYVIQFQLQRFGAGLSLPQLLTTWSSPTPVGDWLPSLEAYASVEMGGLLLPLALLTACLVIVHWRLPLSSAFLILVLAFLAGAKIVNEPYALSALALATVELERRPSWGMQLGLHLLWVVPFAYALLNTPAWAFGLSALQQVFPTVRPSLDVWLGAYRTFRGWQDARLPYVVLAVVFQAGILGAAWSVVRGASRAIDVTTNA